MLRIKKTGQSTAEYAIVIGLVIAAAVAMQVYIKRGIQAKIKGAVDFSPAPGNSNITFTGAQFEPDYALSEMDSTRSGQATAVTLKGGAITRGTANEISTRTGNQTITGL